MALCRLARLAGALLLAGLALEAHAGYLTAKNIETIRKHWPDYSWAVEKVGGLPVAIMPSIHYREVDLREGWYSSKRKTVTRNIGGPFMLDLGPRDNPVEFKKNIRSYEIKIYKKYGGTGVAPRVSHDFRFAALVASHELKTKMRGKGLADAVWGYNGRSKMVSFKKNPYLWSDPQKHKMTAKYRDKNGQVVIYIDQRPGVMIIYQEVLNLQKEGKL